MPNVTGTLQPVDEIAGIAHEAGAAIVVDGAQSVGHVPFKTGGIDYLAMPGHKGLLGCRRGPGPSMLQTMWASTYRTTAAGL